MDTRIRSVYTLSELMWDGSHGTAFDDDVFDAYVSNCELRPLMRVGIARPVRLAAPRVTRDSISFSFTRYSRRLMNTADTINPSRGQITQHTGRMEIRTLRPLHYMALRIPLLNSVWKWLVPVAEGTNLVWLWRCAHLWRLLSPTHDSLSHTGGGGPGAPAPKLSPPFGVVTPAAACGP